MRREHDIAVLAAFALLDADQHALAVNVGDLERNHLRRAQPGAVGDAQRSLVFDAGRRLQEPRDLLGAEDDRQPLRLVDERSMGCDVAPSERDAEKEPQRRHGDVMRPGADAAPDEMQLEEPDVLEARRVGRASQEIGEALDGSDVTFAGFWASGCGSSYLRSCAGAVG